AASSRSACGRPGRRPRSRPRPRPRPGRCPPRRLRRRMSEANRSGLAEALDRALSGGPERHREKSAQQGKLPVRERVARLLDEGSFAEEALLANWEEAGLGADG